MQERIEALWDPGDLATTERMLKGLQLSVKATGDPFLYVQLVARVARAQTLQGHFEEVQETLNELDFVLLDARRRLPAADPRQSARAWGLARLERARFFLAGNWQDAARQCLAEAGQYARESEDAELLQLIQEVDS